MLGFVHALAQGNVLAEMSETNAGVVVVSQDIFPFFIRMNDYGLI